jgi:WD40 repeat protein
MQWLLPNRFAAVWCASALVLAIGVSARGAEPAKAPGAIVAQPARLGRPVDFEKDIYPILEANCLACHSAGAAESQLNIETAESIRKGGKRGPAIVSKNPEASLLFQFASRSKQPAMPPLPNKVEANALTPRELGLLKQWILEGARGGAGSGSDSVQWQPIPPGTKAIFAVALSPDDGRFVAAGRANQVVVYDVPAGREADRLVDPLLSEIKLNGRPMYPEGAADRDFVHAIAFSPDGTLLAAAGYRVVKLWQRLRNVQRSSVPLADAPTALAVSPYGSLVAVALADHSLALRRADGTELRKLAAPAATIGALQFAPDGKTLYAASLDRTWRAYNVADGSLRTVVTADAPLSSLAVTKDGTQLIAGGADGKLRVWKTSGDPRDAAGKPTAVAKPLREWKAHEKPITALALVWPAGEKLVSGSEDGTVRVWQLSSATQLARLDHGGPVTAVAARPDGQVLASAGTNRVTHLWKITGGKPLAEIKGSLSAERLVARLTDAQTIAGQHVTLAAARTAATTQDVKEHEETLKKAAEAQAAADKALAEATAKEKAARDAVVSAKKASQAARKDSALKKKLEDAEKALAALDQPKQTAARAAASAAQVHSTARMSFAAAETKLHEQQALKKQLETARDTATAALGKAVAERDKRPFVVRSLAFSADGSLLALGGDDPEIELCNAQTGRPLEVLAGHSTGVARVAFGKGSTLVSAGSDKRLVVWDANPRWKFFGRIGPKADTLELGSSALISRVLCVAFSPDGRLLATGSGEPSRSGELKTWKIPALTLDREFKDAHSDTVFGVDFSRDGRYLASGAADKFVKVFETKTGKQARSFEGHTHQVLGVGWKADGSLLASAGADNQVKVWNFESGEQQRNINSHTKQVTSIQFLGTTANVVTASGDRTVQLHQAVDGDTYRTLAGASDYLYSAAATPDESLVAAGGEDGVLRLWNGSTGQSVATFGPPPAAKDAVQASAVKR